MGGMVVACNIPVEHDPLTRRIPGARVTHGMREASACMMRQEGFRMLLAAVSLPQGRRRRMVN